VHEIAKGRVWSGVQAKERGLVDDLGGLDVAIARAKALAGLKPDQKVTLKYYPEERGALEQLQALFGAGGQAASAAVALQALAGDERVQRILDLAAPQGAVRARSEPIIVR
jgi:protease-4